MDKHLYLIIDDTFILLVKWFLLQARKYTVFVTSFSQKQYNFMQIYINQLLNIYYPNYYP